MNLKFVEITKVEEDSNQKYGFDDYSVKVYNASTGSYIESKIWKSIATNDSDSFYITLNHADTWQEINDNKNTLLKIGDTTKIKSINFATGSAKSKVTVNSGVKGESYFDLSLAGGRLEYEITPETGYSSTNLLKRKISKFGVAVYEKKTYTVNYKVINDPDTDGAGPDTGVTTTLPSSITASSLQTELNDIYKQSVVSWTVTDSGSQNVEFDVNHSTNFNVEDYGTNSLEGYLVASQAGDANYDRNIFFVDNPSDRTSGWNPEFGKYIFIHSSSGANMKTVAHELGHSLKLLHVNSDSRNILGVLISGLDNIMYSRSSNTKYRLLKKQWDKVYNGGNFRAITSSSSTPKEYR